MPAAIRFRLPETRLPHRRRSTAATSCAIALLCCTLSAGSAAANEAPPASSVELPRLPVAISSFGAAWSEGALYVFGGHTGRAHQHSFDNLSQLFLRLDTDAPERGWQALPPGPALQGTDLVAHQGKLYRVGGLRAINPQGTLEDLHSVASAARFDPAVGGWQALPELPAGRSSHGIAVLDERLVVAGGWQMHGAGEESRWTREVLALDLAGLETADVSDADRAVPGWTVLTEAPVAVRANAVAAVGDELWILGGLDAEGETTSRVDVYDAARDAWRRGPDLPDAGRLRGFGSAAVVVGGHLLVSQNDGVVYVLERSAAGEESWREVASLEHRRFFHRLASDGANLYALGGAGRGGHFDSVEAHRLPNLAKAPETSAAKPSPSSAPSGGYARSEAQQPPKDRGSRVTSFRNGGSDRADGSLPIQWDNASLTWQAALPGFGHSSPVAWDGTVYVTSVTGANLETLWLTALDLATGEEQWRRSWSASEEMESSEMMARAAPTPAVSEDGLVLFFGSGDLFAVDHDGERLWHRDLVAEYGTFTGNHGVGNSVLLNDDLAVVLLARKTYSYLLAVDRETGATRWKTDRAAGVSWSTPMLSPDGREIVVSANGSVDGFDPVTCKRLWQVPEITSNTTQSPTFAGDLVLVAGGERGANFALRLGLRGTLGDEAIAWRSPSTSHFASPVVTAHCIVWSNKAGVVQCVDPSSGEERWTHRGAEPQWATPIVADGRIYLFGENGTVEVLRDSAEAPEVLATNRLELPSTLTGVAAAAGTLLLRAGEQLIAVR